MDTRTRSYSSEQQHTGTLQTLVTEGRSKLETSQEDSQALESVLSELQEQTDNAKELITETFISIGFLFVIPLDRTAKSPSSFLLIGRWLPNTKKKKRCDLNQNKNLYWPSTSLQGNSCDMCVRVGVNVCVATADLYC